MKQNILKQQQKQPRKHSAIIADWYQDFRWKFSGHKYQNDHNSQNIFKTLAIT